MMENAFLLASILTGITLFILGALKSRVTQSNWFRSGLEMLLVGGLAAIVAYLVGYLLGR
jgi:VIT1/CCC1 family predicted Fe2+/Mn2+ transporter